MANLRITSNAVIDSKTIEFLFTEELDSTISTANISRRYPNHYCD
jgi:hypothetical protein